MSRLSAANGSAPAGRGPDYVWEYEYYDDDEPVSFEGLKAHRYSIVIGFWVGLAVFVIFMFFVLTLLTKTGAPHQENPEPCEKRPRLTSCMVDIGINKNLGNKVCSQPLIDESRSIFQCYINEKEQCAGRVSQDEQGWLSSRNSSSLQVEQTDHKKEKDANFLSHFNIPNFVNSEHSSMLDDDDLLLCEPPLIVDSESRPSISRIVS
ncbi:melanocortin-2 receptor aCCessory protein 2A-like [Scleropages formosus]|uniref:Melanocortin 2 receptor accessory protein 2a n=1 Tax=Scleropages formosus TaxID=113540 RepID=A0A0P7V9J2_SCLFO|nr:melanocortin-2 receptor accessory protein 2 isoform X2 [Scleropages formosus]KPP78858.1 melanocortin-2 receptor aCCessory protein 2A-like [Scleropages formosus]